MRENRVKIRTYSQLVGNHISKRFQPRDEIMEQYLRRVRQMIEKFESMDIVQIPRSKNYQADILTWMIVVTNPKMPKSVPMEVKSFLNIEYSLEIMWIEQKGSWIDPIISNMRDGVLPVNKLRVQKIRGPGVQASRYTLIDGVLYWRGYTLPFLRYLYEDDADYVLRNVHERVCRNHSGARSFAYKALRQWYF